MADGKSDYVLRLPKDLRGRIKSVSHNDGKSMNSEMLRVLEREFPERPVDYDSLARSILILNAGKRDPAIQELIDAARPAIDGMISGSLPGVSQRHRDLLIREFGNKLTEQET
ncbi:Arc family DNA-binding protein [Agrobacterium rubi]|nr:Arc family DNA-binding protein [Agrobacterium rubi]NTF24086.1 Arc family DNA-binding protein [Agrobacterium rubi]